MNWLWKIANKMYHRGGVIHKLARIPEMLNFVLCANGVSAGVIIGKNTKFHHHALGCVIHARTVIGSNCEIFQNVTMGSKWSGGICRGGAPHIGNNVFIGAGAVILGDIEIGDNSIIGANAVVTKDVPENSIAVGVPAVISKRKI